MRPGAFLRWRGRLLTAQWRALPDFIVIGAPRAGTTTLYRELVRHPRVEPALHQEVHFFNRSGAYRRGLDYYRAFYPMEKGLRADGSITGEGTSVYMFRPNTAERIARDLPDVRLIAVLRDPAERAIASWEAFRARGEEPKPLLDALNSEIARLGPGEATPPAPAEAIEGRPQPDHVHKGRYADQLTRWLALFDKERLHVVFSDELFSTPSAGMEGVYSFLGLEPRQSPDLVPAPTKSGTPEAEEARGLLRAYYEAQDAELARLLERPLPWRSNQGEESPSGEGRR